jgi:hypothetical protein
MMDENMTVRKLTSVLCGVAAFVALVIFLFAGLIVFYYWGGGH